MNIYVYAEVLRVLISTKFLIDRKYYHRALSNTVIHLPFIRKQKNFGVRISRLAVAFWRETRGAYYRDDQLKSHEIVAQLHLDATAHVRISGRMSGVSAASLGVQVRRARRRH